jgi:hypothetical protein
MRRDDSSHGAPPVAESRIGRGVAEVRGTLSIQIGILFLVTPPTSAIPSARYRDPELM